MEISKRNYQNMHSIDRLSGLPDDVICHILSFLPTKLSVSTSALARRWRFLWAHVPTLNFYRRNFKGATQHSYIINRVMMLHQAKIMNTLRLSHVKCSGYLLETWIIYAVQRSVRNIYLDFDLKRVYDDSYFVIVFTLPRCLLTCKTIVGLKLDRCTGITSRGEVFMPSLKKLHLKYAEFEDDESLPHFLSGCPVLEDLIIDYCYREAQRNTGVVVSSPTIKTLNVDFPYGCEEDKDPCKMLIINVPAIVYLKVNSCTLARVKSLRKTMTSLIEAEFTLNGHWNECHTNCTQHAPDIEFLSSLCHVKCLKFSSHESDTLIDIAGHDSMIKFDHLTKLELNLNVIWDHLVKFLEVADNLQVLIIDLGYNPTYREPERVPKCMLSCLRTVRINDFSVGGDEFEDSCDIVRYTLRNAQVLKMMEIYPSRGSLDKQKLDAIRTISLCERGSKSCQLAFLDTV